jgi:ankyrin repeat protein
MFLMGCSSYHQLNSDIMTGRSITPATIREVAAAGQLDHTDIHGETPLLKAVGTGNTQAVKLLLAAGADPDRTSKGKNTPLGVAVVGQNAEIVEILITEGADVNLPNENGVPPLAIAASAGSTTIMNQLIRAGADVNYHGVFEDKQKNVYRGSVLLQAAAASQSDATTLLLESGADPDLKVDHPPLVLAAERGDVATVKALLDHGADVGVMAVPSGTTAPFVAARAGHLEVMREFLNRGYDPNTVVDVAISGGRRSRQTALAVAIIEGHPAVVELLLESGANPNDRFFEDGSFATPLHEAAAKNDRASVALLLAFGANPSVLNGDGDTPSRTADRNGHASLSLLLAESEFVADRPPRRPSRARSSASSPVAGQKPALKDSLARRKNVERGRNTTMITVPGTVEASTVTGTASIHGSVSSENEIASFTINGREVDLTPAGGFEVSRYLRSGQEKEFELIAIDSDGNRAVRRVMATRGDRPVVSEIQFEALDPGRSNAGRRNRPAAALVIGIEDYKRMPRALHARTDASVFYDYAHRSLAISQSKIIRLVDSDADNIGIQDAVRRLGGLIDRKTDVYVYFAGHGFASGKGVPYLLPHDGDARYLSQLMSRDELFASLVELDARSVTVFLDTCYSGRGRGGAVLAKGMRPLVIASSNEGVPEGFTVISAASSDEWSGDLPEAEHGLFSYFLMRGLGGEADLDGDRTITVEELHGYVAGEVSRQAARLGREQTPELYGERDRVLLRY